MNNIAVTAERAECDICTNGEIRGCAALRLRARFLNERMNEITYLEFAGIPHEEDTLFVCMQSHLIRTQKGEGSPFHCAPRLYLRRYHQKILYDVQGPFAVQMNVYTAATRSQSRRAVPLFGDWCARTMSSNSLLGALWHRQHALCAISSLSSLYGRWKNSGQELKTLYCVSAFRALWRARFEPRRWIN